jgi:hypothetical protein
MKTIIVASLLIASVIGGCNEVLEPVTDTVHCTIRACQDDESCIQVSGEWRCMERCNSDIECGISYVCCDTAAGYGVCGPVEECYQ